MKDLLEHYAGNFPLWLAPLQAKILPISDKFIDYCKEVQKELKAAGIRVEIDDRNEKIGKKIRDTELAKTPYMLVVGEKEMEPKSAAVRAKFIGDKGVMPIADIVKMLTDEIRSKGIS
jgi:threonyl-tRNA synthetase